MYSIKVVMENKNIRKRVLPEARTKIIDLYKNGTTYKAIAEFCDITTGTVGSILKQAGVVRRQTSTGFPVPDKDPNTVGSHGIGYWHMNLNIKSKPIGLVAQISRKVYASPPGYPNKSSMLMGWHMDIVYIKHDKSKLKYLKPKETKLPSPPTETRESFLTRMKNKFYLPTAISID